MALTLMELVTKLTLDASAYDTGLSKAKNDADTFLDTVGKTWNKASSAGKKIWNFAESVVDFFQPILETTAEVESNGRQFVAVFGSELAPAMTKAIRGLEEETGVLASRFLPVATRAYLQFTSAGFETNDALSMTYKLLEYAADGAAMYDIALEDAADRMLKFSRGTVVGGEAIGLFTSMAERDAKAAELFGDEWRNLTEAQRELAMMATVEEIYTAAGVIGMAAAETHTWETVTGNLGEAWKQTVAIFGKPFLDALTPSLEKLTDWLVSNPEKVAKVADALGKMAGWLVESGISLADLLASDGLGLLSGVSELFGFDGGVLTVSAALNSGTEEELQKALDAMELELHPTVVAGKIVGGVIGMTPTGAAAELDDYGIQIVGRGPNGMLYIHEGGTVQIPGEYARGLDYVPYDDFPALLHKGEKVLTSREAETLRNWGGISSASGVEALLEDILRSVKDFAGLGVYIDRKRAGAAVAEEVGITQYRRGVLAVGG